MSLAEREGFEPPEVLPSTVFKTAAFNHSAISPIKRSTIVTSVKRVQSYDYFDYVQIF